MDISQYCISQFVSIREGMERLNVLTLSNTLFVLNENAQVVGSITDGDIRRGLLRSLSLESSITSCMNVDFKYVQQGKYSSGDIHVLKQKHVKLLPILNEDKQIVRIVSLTDKRSLLPINAIVMAGGRGSRLRPFTDTTPKPLLKVGGKPIIEYNIDRLNLYGVDSIYISIKYLGEQIQAYFQDGASKDVAIHYITEDVELGTIGAVAKAENLTCDYVLVMNSDLLTNIDFEDFFTNFVEENADMSVATTPYEIQVPYAIMELDKHKVVGFKEKPTLTYYSNAGIYLMKRELIEHIPYNTFFNATDLMEYVINSGKSLIHYPIRGYWLDIGKHDDFIKAQEDVQHIIF